MPPEPQTPIEARDAARAEQDPKDRDPLRRWCMAHERPYANAGAFSVCSDCYRGKKPKQTLDDIWKDKADE